jgi:hypothetical protein
LIEAAKMAPRYSSALAVLYGQERRKGNASRATLAVASKPVAYLMVTFPIFANQWKQKRIEWYNVVMTRLSFSGTEKQNRGTYK